MFYKQHHLLITEIQYLSTKSYSKNLCIFPDSSFINCGNDSKIMFNNTSKDYHPKTISSRFILNVMDEYFSLNKHVTLNTTY